MLKILAQHQGLASARRNVYSLFDRFRPRSVRAKRVIALSLERRKNRGVRLYKHLAPLEPVN